jgi:hypothetical protein
MASKSSKGKLKFTESFEYNLSYALDYSVDGNLVQGSKLVIMAPSSRISQHASLIEQEFNRAIFEIQTKIGNTMTDAQREKAAEAQKTAPEPTDEEQTQATLSMLFSSANIDKCFIALKLILTHEWAGKAMCLVDGVEKLTQPLFDDLKYADLKNLLALYIENFLATSQKA